MGLDVPLLRQERPWTCLPACIRMVLAYRGQLVEEAEIAAACRTTPLRGTQPERAVEGVQQLGYRALWFENADLARLQDLVDHDWPVIVFLRVPNAFTNGMRLGKKPLRRHPERFEHAI